MEITIKLEFTQQHLEDIIVTALEGGSNYWLMLKAKSSIIKDAKKETGYEMELWNPLSSELAKLMWTHPSYKLPVYDKEEDNELLGHLSLESLVQAMQKHPHEALSIINESYDANDADTLVQTAVMGEVVFG